MREKEYPPEKNRFATYLTHDIDDQEISGSTGLDDLDEADAVDMDLPEMSSVGHVFRGWWSNNWHRK